MAEHGAKRRLAHLVVGRVIAGGVPKRNRLTVKPRHLLAEPVAPLRLELTAVGRQAGDLVAEKGDELRRRLEALHDGIDRREGFFMRSAGDARAGIAVDHELMARPARQDRGQAGGRRLGRHRSLTR
jgi:hypothetical protein